MIELCTADWVIVAVTLGAAMLGVFGGFSGALGFAAGLATAGAAVKFAYAPVAGRVPAGWALALTLLIVALLAFGIARIAVRRVVSGLLAQPADAIFGSLLAGVSGAALSLAVVWVVLRFTDVRFESSLCTLAMDFVGK